MSNVVKKIVQSNDIHSELGLLIEAIAYSSISSNGVFHIGLSGGSLVQLLAEILPSLNTNWDKWKLYFCDERVVPFDSSDSTYGAYKVALWGKIPIKDEQFVTMTPGLSAPEAAVDYEQKLRKEFGADGLPRFDLLLLGMGPDGHTCSLFPGHPLLNEDNLWVAPITDSPKPPPARITFTLPVVNNAKNCAFAINGKGKANILKRILDDKEDLPVTRVNPVSGKLYWIIDKDAASELKS